MHLAHGWPGVRGHCELGANRVGKGTFEPFADDVPVLFLAQHEAVHPAVALAKHLDEQLFHFLPAVIAPEQQVLDGITQFGTRGITELLQRGARGAR